MMEMEMEIGLLLSVMACVTIHYFTLCGCSDVSIYVISGSDLKPLIELTCVENGQVIISRWTCSKGMSQ